MEYINGLNAINHFSKCSTNDIKEIVLKLKNYLKNNIADAELIKPPIKKIKEKILSLKKILINREPLKITKWFLII